MEFVSNMTKLATGKENVLAAGVDCTLYKVGKLDTKEADYQNFQDKVGKSLKIPASQESLSCIPELQVKNGFPKVAGEIWVTVQEASCLYHFYSFKSCLFFISCLLR